MERFICEAKILEIMQSLLQAARHQEVPFRRELPNEEVERGSAVHVVMVIAGSHGQLVKIGKKGDVVVVHPLPRRRYERNSGSVCRVLSHGTHQMSTAPASRTASNAFAPSPAFSSTARVASVKTIVSKPRFTASTAVSLTQ